VNVRRVATWTIGVLLVLAMAGFLAFLYLIPPFDLFRLNRMGSLYFTSAGLADYIAERAEMMDESPDEALMVRFQRGDRAAEWQLSRRALRAWTHLRR